MGGATFVDGVRRWFQRGSSSVNHHTSSLASSSNISTSSYNHSTDQIHKQQVIGGEEEDGLRIIEDFDFSGLKSIKVPKRVNFPAMDPHKKVVDFLSFCNLLI